MSKILIHSLVFSPDSVSTAYLYNDIALRFKKEGYDVSVLTTTPHYNRIEEKLKKQPLRRKWLGLYYTSDYNGITVKHISQRKFKNTLLRIIGFLYWHILSFFLGLFEKKVDVILSPSPPLTIGFINILLGKIKGCKVIYNVQEIYPDLLIKEGGMKSKTIISALQLLERFVYNYSDAVTTIDQVFYDTIVNRFNDVSKLSIIPNFVDTAIYKPLSLDTIQIDQTIFPKIDALKLMYAGNIGHAQDWKPLIELAINLKDENIEFFIIGEGAMKDFLQQSIKEHHLDKVHLIPYQSRELMPSLIAYADIQFIFMAPLTEEQGFPSKVYTIMACGKPMLICSGNKTPIFAFLKDKDCAYLITEKDMKKKIDLMSEILKNINKKKLQVMGSNGLKDINLNYSKEIVTDKYVTLIGSLMNEGKG